MVSEKKKTKIRPPCRIDADDVLKTASVSHMDIDGAGFRRTLVELFRLADEDGCGDKKSGEGCSLAYRQVLVLVCLLRAAVPGLDTECQLTICCARKAELCAKRLGQDGAIVANTAYSLLMGRH